MKIYLHQQILGCPEYMDFLFGGHKQLTKNDLVKFYILILPTTEVITW